MADFSGVDFLRLDELLSDEEKLARQSVREFVSKEFLPCIQEHVRKDGSFPMALVPKMAELGLFGANLHGYGCAGMNNVAYGLVMQELERGDSGLRSFASVQGGLVMYPIYSYGTPEQKERWLPELSAGRAIGCFGLTEPDAGSHVGRHAHEGRAPRLALDPERHQALDHQRLARRRRGDLGAHARTACAASSSRRARAASRPAT